MYVTEREFICQVHDVDNTYEYNGRLPVEALAPHSWPPIQKKHNTHILTEKSTKNNKREKWHVHAQK